MLDIRLARDQILILGQHVTATYNNNCENDSKMMSYTSEKCGLSKRYTNRCVLHHCKFLIWNKSQEDISYVRTSRHKSEASIKSYARKLPSSKRAISNTFSRTTGFLATSNASLTKKTKNNQAAQPKVFSPKHVSCREQQSQVIPVSPLSMIPGKLF